MQLLTIGGECWRHFYHNDKRGGSLEAFASPRVCSLYSKRLTHPPRPCIARARASPAQIVRESLVVHTGSGGPAGTLGSSGWGDAAAGGAEGGGGADLSASADQRWVTSASFRRTGPGRFPSTYHAALAAGLITGGRGARSKSHWSAADTDKFYALLRQVCGQAHVERVVKSGSR
jgi:hypothetical protein